MSGVVVSKSATTTPSCTETLAAIASEIRARAVVWLDENLKEYDLRLADRIEAAARREADKLIPAKNIEFSDGNGRRQIAYGWVKAGEEPLALRPATEQDMDAGRASWCAACATDCMLRGKDALVVCDHFKKNEKGGAK